ncbi:MAG: helix-turn-helix domain-containing protein [Bacteroidota bacterium]
MKHQGHLASENLFQVLKTHNRAELEQKVEFTHPVLDSIGRHFVPGEYFYVLTDFQDFKIIFMHPNAERMIPVVAANADFPDLLEPWHQEDAVLLEKRERVVFEFFMNRIPTEELKNYKSTYTVRIKDLSSNYRLYLMQTIVLQTTPKGKMAYNMTVFTDLTDFNIPYSKNINIIGLNGRPSYRNIEVKPDPEFIISEDPLLSHRERETLQLLAQGHTQEEVASQLDVAFSTVRSHANSILKKLNAKNQSEAIRIALQRGLIA